VFYSHHTRSIRFRSNQIQSNQSNPNQSTAPVATTSRATALFAQDDDPSSERGVSVDQDGKSNVWAIEPKMEVDTTSGEDKIKGYLAGAVGLVAFAGAAGFALTNLPDPNQF
jgi:hypothetical protein